VKDYQGFSIAALASLVAAKSLSAVNCGGLTLEHILTHRPDALLSVANKDAVKFISGALAGAIGKSLTAPFDRLKLLMQVKSTGAKPPTQHKTMTRSNDAHQHSSSRTFHPIAICFSSPSLQVKGGMQGGQLGKAAASGGLVQSFLMIGREEGLKGYWKGNWAQVVRVLPYSAAQLYSYDVFKSLMAEENGHLTIQKKLVAGACAGMFSTLVTYPLDTIRLRMAVDPKCKSITQASKLIFHEGGMKLFYRGAGTALLGIAPYMALELAAFDTMPQGIPSFARGFMAALMATSVCYPLDTVRRQMQVSLPVDVSRILTTMSLVTRK